MFSFLQLESIRPNYKQTSQGASATSPATPPVCLPGRRWRHPIATLEASAVGKVFALATASSCHGAALIATGVCGIIDSPTTKVWSLGSSVWTWPDQGADDVDDDDDAAKTASSSASWRRWRGSSGNVYFATKRFAATCPSSSGLLVVLVNQ